MTDNRREVISIHSLRVEGDVEVTDLQGRLLHFNPLPPCGGRLAPVFLRHPKGGFQSTPSVWRETTVCHPWVFPIFRFQSTPSVWRETKYIDKIKRGGSDFNPLPPCGGRRRHRQADRRRGQFQSTPSVWRETPLLKSTSIGTSDFNPLPPCGGRRLPSHRSFQVQHFNPLPPCGGRPKKLACISGE